MNPTESILNQNIMYLNTILINVQGQFTMLKFECLLFVYG